MPDLTLEELRATSEMMITAMKGRKPTLDEATAFDKIDHELSLREEADSLDFEDCLSCNL